METLVNRLCSAMLARHIIDRDGYDICVYGLEILFSNLLLFSAIGCIAVFTGTFWASVWFTVLFCVLRFHLGGYHCKRYGACFVFSLCIYLGFLACYCFGAAALLPAWLLVSVCLLSSAFLLLRTLRTAPINRRNALLCLLYPMVALLLLFLRQPVASFSVVFSMIAVSFLLILNKGDLYS